VVFPPGEGIGRTGHPHPPGRPRLPARHGVGVETAGSLLVTAGDNPQMADN
jgi:hypothetical protein